MADTKLAPISGVCRPSRRMMNIATVMHGSSFALRVDTMLEDATVVEKMAAMLDRAFDAGLAKDGTGRLDLRESAIFLIREMRRNQK